MVEYERTYLPRALPCDIGMWPSEHIVDVYIPSERSEHPRLRARRKGDVLELTKKLQICSGDASVHSEVTIPLTASEYRELVGSSKRRLSKTRFSGSLSGVSIEVDIFEAGLHGLALVDVEFDSRIAMDDSRMPDFCLADVTQEDFIAGGLLAGRKYDDIAEELEKFGYRKLFMDMHYE